MAPDDFLHDVQSKPQAVVAIAAFALVQASLKRTKHPIQQGSLDGRSAVQNFANNVRRAAGHGDADRTIGSPVLDGIRDEITDHLLEAPAVPAAHSVAGRRKLNPPVWMAYAKLLHLIGEQWCHVGFDPAHADPQSELGTIEIH